MATPSIRSILATRSATPRRPKSPPTSKKPARRTHARTRNGRTKRTRVCVRLGRNATPRETQSPQESEPSPQTSAVNPAPSDPASRSWVWSNTHRALSHQFCKACTQISGLLFHLYLAAPVSYIPPLSERTSKHLGRLTQLVRVPLSHSGSDRFESCIAHHFSENGGREAAATFSAPFRAAFQDARISQGPGY